MTEDQLKEMLKYLRSLDIDGDASMGELAHRAYLAGFEAAQKPLPLDRALGNLDFLLKSGFYTPKKK